VLVLNRALSLDPPQPPSFGERLSLSNQVGTGWWQSGSPTISRSVSCYIDSWRWETDVDSKHRARGRMRLQLQRYGKPLMVEHSVDIATRPKVRAACRRSRRHTSRAARRRRLRPPGHAQWVQRGHRGHDHRVAGHAHPRAYAVTGHAHPGTETALEGPRTPGTALYAPQHCRRPGKG